MQGRGETIWGDVLVIVVVVVVVATTVARLPCYPYQLNAGAPRPIQIINVISCTSAVSS